jgi:hypothetical protein
MKGIQAQDAPADWAVRAERISNAARNPRGRTSFRSFLRRVRRLLARLGRRDFPSSCPVLGVKLPSPKRSVMTAFDPEPPSMVQFFCVARSIRTLPGGTSVPSALVVPKLTTNSNVPAEGSKLSLAHHTFLFIFVG